MPAAPAKPPPAASTIAATPASASRRPDRRVRVWAGGAIVVVALFGDDMAAGGRNPAGRGSGSGEPLGAPPYPVEPYAPSAAYAVAELWPGWPPSAAGLRRVAPSPAGVGRQAWSGTSVRGGPVSGSGVVDAAVGSEAGGTVARPTGTSCPMARSPAASVGAWFG